MQKLNEFEFGFENDKFFIDVPSCSRDVGNIREESESLARALHNRHNKIILGLSSGVDSQTTLHSFLCQGLKIDTAFMYLPGYNETEFNQLQILIKKYSLDPIIVELDPEALKDNLFKEYYETGIPPYQLLHKTFVSKLPDDYCFVSGLDGPEFAKGKEKWYVVMAANSQVNTRFRGIRSLNRSGKDYSFEQFSELYLSIVNDDVIKAYMYAHNNIVNNGLVYADGEKIPSIYHWDLYIKTIMYGKYWKDELEYFPKYQGCENIDWIMHPETPWHGYEKNTVLIPYLDFIDHLSCLSGKSKKWYSAS